MEMENKLKIVSIRLNHDGDICSDKTINGPEAAIEVFAEVLQDMDKEVLAVMNLRSGKVINVNIVSMGTVNYTLALPSEVYKSAILSDATHIMLMHNHPTGNCVPSKADIEMTNHIIDAGKVIGIDVQDHIIVGYNQFYSMEREETVDFESHNCYFAQSNPVFAGRSR